MKKINWQEKLGTFCHVKRNKHCVLTQFETENSKHNKNFSGTLCKFDKMCCYICRKDMSVIKVAKWNIIFD